MRLRIRFVEDFLNRFSYAFKIRFLVILGFLYVVFLTIMVLYLKLPNFLIAVIGVGLISFLLMYATRAIRRPLENLKDAAYAFARGDLTVRASIISNDEVADITRAFNDMAEFFERTASVVNKISLSCTEGATKVSRILKEQESAAAFQNETMRTLLVCSRENMVKMNNFFYSLNEVNKRSDVTAKLAFEGRSNLNEMQKILHQMKSASGNIVAALDSLNGQVGKATDVISQLVEMADQTNLLFLNTAIKASKTGKEGVGFVIIADKIRELADRISFTTLDIERSLNETFDEVSAAVLETNLFFARIVAVDDDNKIVNEGLCRLIEQTREQIATIKRVDFEKEEQFAEYTRIDELNSQMAELTYHASNNTRRLCGDVEFLLQGAQSLRPIIEKLRFK